MLSLFYQVTDGGQNSFACFDSYRLSAEALGAQIVPSQRQLTLEGNQNKKFSRLPSGQFLNEF